eukprot:5566931-Prymnesium_polylepis.1
MPHARGDKATPGLGSALGSTGKTRPRRWSASARIARKGGGRGGQGRACSSSVACRRRMLQRPQRNTSWDNCTVVHGGPS